MTVRQATPADQAILKELWEAFVAEADDLYPDDESWEQAWPDVRRTLDEGGAFLAEESGHAVGFVLASLAPRGRPFAHVTDLYVRPERRRSGVGKALLGAIAQRARERGLPNVSLDVELGNRDAIAVYDRLGFRAAKQWMVVALDELDERMSRTEQPSSGRVYIQTDDETAVERAVQQFVPRLGRSERTEVSPPRNGWIEIDDELCSREPRLLRRLAKELSARTGAVVLTLGIEEGAVVRYVLFERGSVADEYASIPEYHGPLPPGDVVALGANPTVLARLTGADPARVRAVARSASPPAELPPPDQLLAELAAVLGVGST